jgi:hypothetical protein
MSLPRTRTLAFAAALSLWMGALPSASAQAPKAGDWYEDTVDLGFKIKAPKGWEYVPAAPDATNLIGKYTSPDGQWIADTKSNTVWNYQCWLLKFDRREVKKTALDSKPKYRRKSLENIEAWAEEGRAEGFSGTWALEEKDDLKVGKLEATEYEFIGNMRGGQEVKLYAVVYPLDPEYEVAVVFNGPGERKWSKYKSAFSKLAKSLKPLEVERRELEVTGGSLRDIKRAKLQMEADRSEEWNLYETPNYFVISNNPDEDFIDELLERLEAIRLVYEELYPAELAERLRKLAKEESGDTEKGERTVVAGEDPMERSRTSVVRVCKTRELYNSYGGPPSTGGYWSSNDEELVLFDDKQVLGRNSTWGTLNHEAFHQYIYYFFGNLAPHSWYNEGHGDFFGGYEYKHKKFELTRYEKRIRTIQQAIRGDEHAPLKEIVRYTQAEYYAGDSVFNNYAQGWSMIYFLRMGKENARCWNDDWDSILDTYLEVLVKTGDLDKAVDEAYAGVDWYELEECWKAFTLE